MTSVPLKYVAKVTYGLGQPPREAEGGVPVLRATNIHRGKIVRSGLMRARPTDVPWQRCPPLRPGEILVVRSGAYTGDSALVTEEWRGAAPGYDLRVTPHRIDPRYLAYVLLSAPARDYFNDCRSRAAQPHLNADQVANLRVPGVDRSVQHRIADFLDVETSRIDSTVELRTRQERLLAERLTAAEDLELNPRDDPDWVPRRLSQLCDPARPIQYGIVLPGPSVPDGVLLVKGGDIKPGRLAPTRLSRTSREIESSFARSRLKARDLVFAIRGGVGDVERVPGSLVGANITQDVARIAPLLDVDEVWLLHALRSSLVQSQAAAMITGATITGINIGDLRRLMIVVPPSEVQRQIGVKIAARSAAYARLSETIHRQIALLRERRQTLITAAVAGKLQVPSTTTANGVE